MITQHLSHSDVDSMTKIGNYFCLIFWPYQNPCIKKLLDIEGIGLSKATKVLHKLYPQIIPMIDKALQEEYRKKINRQWTEEQPNQIFIDYYRNLKEDCNRQHLAQIHNAISKNNLKRLTKVRVFDILWWPYLKAKRLSERYSINWSTIR